jgi:hypothetical protein
VVTVDHTYEASEVTFPGGRIEVQTLPESSSRVRKKVIETRVSDVRFVLDGLEEIRA